MFNLIIAAGLLSASLGTSLYYVWSKNNDIANNIKKSEEIKIAQDRVTLSGSYSTTGISSKSDISKKISLSTLTENKLSLNEKELLDDFQKAVKESIIKNNINNPTCVDLKNTGLISESDCIKIKDKTNTFVDIDNGKIKVKDSDVSNIINNKEHFNMKIENNDGTTTYKTFDKNNMVANRKIIQKQINKNDSFVRIINTFSDENSLKELANNLISRYENSGRDDFYALNRIEKIYNRIEYLRFKTQLDNAIATNADSTTISNLESQYEQKLMNSEEYYIENGNSIDSNYLDNRLTTLKQKINY